MSDEVRELTPAEVARMKGWTLNYTYQQIWAGRIQATKVDGTWRVPVEQLKPKEVATA